RDGTFIRCVILATIFWRSRFQHDTLAAKEAIMDVSIDDIKVGALYAMRHYVTLSYYGKTPEIMAKRGIAEISVCSTFVVQIRETWFLATAGHVLDSIRKD